MRMKPLKKVSVILHEKPTLFSRDFTEEEKYEIHVEDHSHSISVDNKVVTQSKTIIRCKK